MISQTRRSAVVEKMCGHWCTDWIRLQSGARVNNADCTLSAGTPTSRQRVGFITPFGACIQRKSKINESDKSGRLVKQRHHKVLGKEPLIAFCKVYL